MSIRQLKIFLSVAKHGSLAGAAGEMGLTQAAVSLQMKALEENLKTKLFDRSRRSIVLNASARSLIPQASEIVSLYESLPLSVDSKLIGGTMHIGAISATSTKILPDALLLLRKKHPRIDVRVVNGRSDELARQVENGDLDVALVSGPPAPLSKSLCWHLVTKDPLVLIAPRNMPVKSLAHALSHAPFIRLSRTTWTGRVIENALREKGLTPPFIMELDSTDIVAGMVSRGLGVSVIPLDNGNWRNDLDLQIFALRDFETQRMLGLIERQNHGRTRLTEAFRESLASVRTNQGFGNKLRKIPFQTM